MPETRESLIAIMAARDDDKSKRQRETTEKTDEGAADKYRRFVDTVNRSSDSDLQRAELCR